MFYGSLAFIFEVMIYVGLGLPLVNLLLGLLGSIGQSGADINVDADMSMDMNMDMDINMDIDMDLDFDVSPEVDFNLGGTEAGSVDLNAGSAQNSGFVIRFDVYCLCFSLVVMGAVGIFAVTYHEGFTRIILLVLGVVMALTAYGLVYRFIMLPLKKNNAAALKVQNLRFQHAIVTFRILRDSPGQIQTKDAVGAVISFRAELDPDICVHNRIDEQEEVIITEIDRKQNLCYVKPADRKILS